MVCERIPTPGASISILLVLLCSLTREVIGWHNRIRKQTRSVCIHTQEAKEYRTDVAIEENVLMITNCTAL